jgi:glycosyltransferase involved in cell wall biosynthesis
VGEAVRLDGVEVWYFPVTWPRRLYYSPAMKAALESRIAGFNLVHLHSVFLWPTAAAARAARRSSVPYLLAPRGMLVPDLLRRRGRWRKTLWIRLVESRNLAAAAGLHVTSDLEADEAARLGLPLPPVHVIPNGVDDEPFDESAPLAPPVRDLLAGPPFLLFLGRLSWKKGLDRLIPALAHVPGARLALAGPDDEGIRPALEQLARDARVEGTAVTFLGPVEGNDRAALLHRAAALVLPSYSENFGNVVLEAMAAGRPVVVTPEVGLAPVVNAAGAGLVVEGDPARLGAALLALLADPARRAAMGRRGAEEVQRRFGWDAIARQTEEVYQRVLEDCEGRLGHGR